MRRGGVASRRPDGIDASDGGGRRGESIPYLGGQTGDMYMFFLAFNLVREHLDFAAHYDGRRPVVPCMEVNIQSHIHAESGCDLR